MFESMCQPFLWDNKPSSLTDQDAGEANPGPSQMFVKGWLDEVPSLMLSDTEDDSSVPEYSPARKRPLHEPEPKRRNGSGRHVRFGEAHVREHPMIPGGHDTCCAVLPLSLDWGFQDEWVYDIDAYENMRERNGRKERGKVGRIDLKLRRRIALESSGDVSRIVEERQERIGFDSVRREDQFVSEYEAATEDEIGTPRCTPFEAFQESAWGLFGCNGTFPSMTVQILED